MAQKILVVEDEPAIADNITYALGTEGFEVRWVTTAAQAREAMVAALPDLIVLDVGLPDESGFDFCRDVRRTSNVAIVFVTARTDEIDRIVGLEIGADDYVVKPFSPRELSARVRAILRRNHGSPHRAPAEGATTPSPWSVDEQRRRIAYYGRMLDLSRYEYRLLEILIKRPGWVFSRDKLMELVWEEPEASLDRTVDTHIKTLRAKLRKVKPKIEAIVTHRGMGYSLRETWPDK